MTKSNALFIGWNRTVPGREAQAGELFSNYMELFASLTAAESVERVTPCFLTSHGGAVNGFWLVEGTNDQLQALRSHEQFYKLTLVSGMIMEGFSVIDAFTGAALQQAMTDWTALAANAASAAESSEEDEAE